jgi:hypothetical protein
MRALLALFLIALAGCSMPDEQRQLEQAKVALPTKLTVPIGLSDDCECVEGKLCPVFEIRAGYLEARAVRCIWTDKVDEAKCEYEKRFVAQTTGQDGQVEYVPEQWGKETMIARHLGNNRWCAASIEA